MKPSIAKVARIALYTALLILPATYAAASDVPTIEGNFTGKAICKNGVKKAEFKTVTTQMVTYHSASDISKVIDELTWPSPSNTMTFNEREDQKIDLQKALKKIKALSCTPEDTNILQGAQSGMQQGIQAPSGTEDPPYQGHRVGGPQ